jgi:membrane-bound serine protease (ClpP class)
MTLFRLILSVLFAFFCLIAPRLQAREAWKHQTLVVPLTQELLSERRGLRDLERLLEEARQSGVTVVVFEIDLAGPTDLATQTELLDQLARAGLPNIAWVRGTATGPGALAALACDTVYLDPNAIIGGAGLEQAASEGGKADENFLRDQSILRAKARSLAERHGHRPEVAEAFIDPRLEVKIGEEVISRKGEVLTLTAAEAVRAIEGRPLLAKGIAESVENLLKSEGRKGGFVRMTPREFGESATREKLGRETAVKAADAATEAEELASGLGTEAPRAAPLFRRRDEGSFAGKVIVLKVGEDTLATGEASFDFMDRTLRKAELDGAEAVIFDMDTPGGFAWHTESLVLNSLQNVSFPTYTFVNSRAESAGAIIAVGTDHIYMRPAATIGSALVVSGTGQDLAESMEDKVTQMIIGTVRNVAELKGHNPDVAEAFVTREKEVRVDGVLIHEAGSVLNLNTVGATEIVGGRPVLAKGVARDLEDLIAQEALEGGVVEATPLGMEAFAHWVQKLSFVLLIVGLAGAYLEMNSPGFGFPGLVSVGAFSLFFFGNYLAGNLAGYELAVLFAVGLLLIAVEVFLFPGTIVAGLAGVVLVIASLGLAMVDRVDLEWKWSGLPSAESWASLLKASLYSLALGMAGALAAVLLGMRFFPGTKMGSRLVLSEVVPSGASLGASQRKGDLVGARGEAVTDLRPSGKGLFEGRLLDLISDGEFIAKGSALRVVKQEGSRIVVAATEIGEA